MGVRWCTGKLKIDPIKNFIKQVTTGKQFTCKKVLGCTKQMNSMAAVWPPIKNPAHNEPGLLQNLVEAAGVEPVATETEKPELAGVIDEGEA